MAGTDDKKQQIRAALAEVRIQVQTHLLLLRRNLNVGHYILESIRNHPWEWIGGAAIFGWLLSRVPVRKKRIYIYSSSQEQVKSHGKEPLGKLWKEAWCLLPVARISDSRNLAQRLK
jgi:hypothetical protein